MTIRGAPLEIRNRHAGAPLSIQIRYATTDDDCIAIHRFLFVVTHGTLPGPVDGPRSATEVWRVAQHDVALMAVRDDVLVGTMGLVQPDFWWGNVKFLASRWFFAIPGSGAGKPLLAEAEAIAKGSGVELHVFDEAKGRLVIFNKSPLRGKPTFLSPQAA